MKNLFILLFLLIPLAAVNAQEEGTPQRFTVNGYVKNLQTLLFFNDAYPAYDNGTFRLVDTFLQDNLIHNRLNFQWYVSEHFNLKADFRNRIFFGDLVKATPNYGRLVDNANNDYFDLSAVLVDDPSFVIHSMIDRLYLEYVSEKWEIRLGRQRVNWGINTVWNPNDIFNAFNFTDFDYEERPGSDALRIRRYLGVASSVEVVATAFDTWDEAAVAGMWRFNKWNYDIQLLAGLVERDLALGAGWAGNLGNAGLKGELTWFLPLESAFPGYEAPNSFALTFAVDYSFANSLYVNAGYLYNSNGSVNVSSGRLFEFELTARNLYPYRHAVFAQASYPATPLLNTSLALIYSPVDVHALFLNPALTYSVAQNWDLDFVGQLVFNRQPDKGYTSPVHALFLRMKWSF